MPRHKDKRLRLIRTDSGHKLPEGVTELVGPFRNECHCQIPGWCNWTPAKERAAKYGMRPRTGKWETADGRFKLEWFGQQGRASKSYPHGYLRLWDTVTRLESWHVALVTARAEILRRLNGGAGALSDRCYD